MSLQVRLHIIAIAIVVMRGCVVVTWTVASWVEMHLQNFFEYTTRVGGLDKHSHCLTDR